MTARQGTPAAPLAMLRPGDDKPVTVARIEKALDRLADLMASDRRLARKLLPLYTWFEEEADALREQDEHLQRVLARARRSKDQRAARFG